MKTELISFKQTGNFSKLTSYFEKVKEIIKLGYLDDYGRQGCKALSAATPVDTGLTAASWSYKIIHTTRTVRIVFYNSNIQNGIPIAVILQYGHATGNGGWVEGRDYINPAIQPVFDDIAKNAWRRITKL